MRKLREKNRTELRRKPENERTGRKEGRGRKIRNWEAGKNVRFRKVFVWGGPDVRAIAHEMAISRKSERTEKKTWPFMRHGPETT